MSDGRLDPSGPNVVALGGGHGLSVALRAIRRYAGSVTAIVSVADDGGSSGRLRRDLGVLAPGDLRRCLVALADDEVWSAAFEHRFAGGELDGHPLGNLVLVGLAETLGGFPAALDEAARLLRAVGRVLPACTEPVELKAEVGRPGGVGAGSTHAEVAGQMAVAMSNDIRRVSLVPSDPPASPEALAALAAADQIVIAPGSLYTSIVPVICVPALSDALGATPGGVVQVSNLRPQAAETTGLDGTDHLAAVLDHGARVDTFLYDEAGELRVDAARVRKMGVEPLAAVVAAPDAHSHDPVLLAQALRTLAGA